MKRVNDIDNQMFVETGKVECISSDESSDESSGVYTSDLGRRRRRKRCRSSNNDVAKYHKKEESVDLLNSAEEEEEDCASGSEPDPELTARIHQKASIVVKNDELKYFLFSSW